MESQARIASLLLLVLSQWSSVDGMCGGYFTGLSGTFWSPNFPYDHYDDNSYCQYTITTPPGYSIYLTFLTLDLEYGSYECPFDRVTIYSPGSGQSQYHCGYYDCSFSFYEPSNYLTVIFQSDSSVTSTGFFAEYYSYLAKCEEGWLGHEGACYSFEEEPKTAPEAQLECEKAGANLASVHSEEEYSFISANAPSSPLWIGLKKHGSRSIWTDGSAFDDVDVSSKFHFEDGFALVSKDQSIRDDLPGDKEYPFVCKKLLKPMSVGSISHQS